MIEKLNLIQQGIYDVLVKLGYVPNEIIKSSEDVLLEPTKDKAHGDYATNTAMRLARPLKKAPQVIAKSIVESLDISLLPLSKVEIAGPGFINFTLNASSLMDVFLEINDKEENFANSSIGSGKKIDLEYVSANPTGYLHVGHGRGAAYGDSLSRVMTKAGYKIGRAHV